MMKKSRFNFKLVHKFCRIETNTSFSFSNNKQIIEMICLSRLALQMGKISGGNHQLGGNMKTQ
jgi:hypothetical protein